jgi:hypothetical protein
MKVTILIALFLLTTSCTTSKQLRIKEKMQNSPITDLSFWHKYESANLEDKLITVPEEMIQYLRWDNEANHYPEVPKSPTVSSQEIEFVRQAIKTIPTKIKKIINDRLVAIFFVEELGSTAFTDGIKNSDGLFKKGFIALDIKALNRKANEWCSWKESSPFIPGEFSVRCTIEHGDQDNKINAIQYILLHEMGHILNIDNPNLPYWAPTDKQKNNEMSSYEYVNLSWKSVGDKLVYQNDNLQKYLGKINYYSREPKLPSQESVLIYDQLGQSNFASLYSMTHLSDDFAEAFVTYVHTEMMRKPFLIEIFHGSKKVKEFKSCWKSQRCKSKLQSLKKVMGI